MRVVQVMRFGGPEVLAPDPNARPDQVVMERAADAHAALEARSVLGKTLLLPN